MESLSGHYGWVINSQIIFMVEALHELDPNFLTGLWHGAGTVLVHGKVIPYNEKTKFKLLRVEPVIVYNYQQFT